jgi:hypothetical protein
MKAVPPSSPKQTSIIVIPLAILCFSLIVFVVILLSNANYTGGSDGGKEGGTRIGPAVKRDLPVLRVNLDEFGRYYDANSVRAEVQYEGKIISIRSRVESIIGDRLLGRVQLRGIWTNAGMLCEFNDDATPQLVNVSQGQIVTVRGRFIGMDGFDLKMKSCRVESIE